MKNSPPARAIASLIITLLLLAAPAAVLAKKGEKNFKRGLQHEQMQQWERAAQEYALAVAANPSETEYQLHYRRAVFNASQRFMEQGRALSEQGDYVGAYNAFRQAYGYDPVNELALAEMERMLRLQREKEGAKANGTKNGTNGANGGAAVGAGGAAQSQPAAYAGDGGARVVNASAQDLPAPRSEQLRVVNYSGDLEGFIRKMAEELGLNVIFDQAFQKRTVNVNLRNVTAAKALDYTFIAQNLFFQKLDRRTILVADQAKRGQYQQLVLRTFYLQNIEPDKARALIQAALPPNQGRQPQVVPNKETNSVTVRDTPENIRLIGQLLQGIDKDRSEVVMDVNIYEVSRNDLLQLGNQLGDAGSLGNLGGLNPTAVLVGGQRNVTVGTGAAASVLPTALAGAFVLPPTRLSAFQRRDNTRLLAHTLVHAFDGEQSTTRIGQRVPVQTAAVTPYYGGGANPAPSPGSGATGGLFGGGYPVIQYQDTGLILKFTPQVFPNQDVQVKLEIESNDVIPGPNELTPVFSQRSVTGTARVPNNRTMMLASVAQQKESRGKQGLPLLGLIPVLGRLFSTPTRDDRDNDIVITVTPRVMRAPVVTPEDIEIRQSGSLTAPLNDSLEAMVHDAEREEQLAAARRLPTNVSLQLPAAGNASAPAAAATQSAANTAAATPAVVNVAPTADPEPPSFVPAPKALAGGATRAAPNAVPAVNAAPAAANAFAANGPAAVTAGASNTGATAAGVPAPFAAAASLFVVVGGEMRVGQRQRVMLLVNSATPLALAAATLKFDPRVVAVRSVTKGSIFNGPQPPTVTPSVDPRGTMLALVAPPAGAPVSGMGVLIFVELEALAAGESELGFEPAGVHLMSADGRSVAAQLKSARLVVKQ